MNATTTLSFVLIGIALGISGVLAALSTLSFQNLLIRVIQGCCLLVGIAAVLTLGEYSFGWHIGSEAIFYDATDASDSSLARQMVPETAICFLLLATALSLHSTGHRSTRLMISSAVAGLLVVVTSLSATMTYAIPQLGMSGGFWLTIMTMHNTVLFILLGGATIWLVWQKKLLPWALSGKATLAFATAMALLAIVGLIAIRSHAMFSRTGSIWEFGYPIILVGVFCSVLISITVLYKLNAVTNRRLQVEKELQRSLNRLHDIAGRLPGMIFQFRCRTDGSTCLPYASDAIRDIFGVAPDDVAKDASAIFEKVHPDDLQGFTDSIRTSAEEITPWRHMFRTRRAHSEQWLFGDAIPRRESDGSILWHGFVTDVTERKLLEQELLRSNAELEQFGYAISHDMRQPLRMVSSYLQLLEMDLADKLDEEKRGYLNTAVDGARRLDQMLVSLLEYARIGRDGEPKAYVESHALLEETLLFLGPMITETGARITINGDWPSVFVSRDEMVRLLQNLISNACKFRVPGRVPEIDIRSEVNGREWQLSITDNGTGIINGQSGRLFQVFQRLHARTEYEGNGVGLALCRKIVEHHGGRIWAESEGEGKGSRFCIALPRPVETQECTPNDVTPDANPKVYKFKAIHQ